jgi:uncharacterized protein YprB with RNaseH-like and TPR domain
MLSDEVRKRLERLQDSALSSVATPATVSKVSPKPNTKRAELPAGEVVTTASGKHYRIRSPLAEYWREGAGAILAAAKSENPAVGSSNHSHPELFSLSASFPQRALFLDLETCGLSGSAIFLIGLLWHDGSGLVLDQLLARDYAEEKPILETLCDIVGRSETLVTFNGKSFDWPMVQDRATVHHLPLGRMANVTMPLVHCDVLHHARRLWGDKLPDCKLQTLEQHFCKRNRRGDIPGSEIPAAYHQFVKTNHAAQLRQILEHNALDLLTLVQVSLRICFKMEGDSI